MFKNLKFVDIIFVCLALLFLIFAEIAWFTGDKEGALFVGLWVPSILGFAIYLKLLKMNQND